VFIATTSLDARTSAWGVNQVLEAGGVLAAIAVDVELEVQASGGGR